MSKEVRIGNISIGNGNRIAIQSMTNCDSRDKKALLNQIAELKDLGCDIVRISIPDMEAASVFKEVKDAVSVPLVADIHFDYRLALASIESGADKIRINPGNIGDFNRVKAVVEKAKERNIPIRIGVNSGSLERNILDKYKKVTPDGLVESAILNLKMIEDMGYDNLVISIKSSNVKDNYLAHKLLIKETDHPIHIGITEAGTITRGKVKSAVGIGALLLEGIGDTIRVSLTANPREEVIFAKEILRSLDLIDSGIDLISCPTCGRTRVDMERLANEIETKLNPIEKKLLLNGKPGIRVAVMGCAVNGPGEAKEADFGVACGEKEGLLFMHGEILKKVAEKEIVSELIKLIEENI